MEPTQQPDRPAPDEDQVRTDQERTARERATQERDPDSPGAFIDDEDSDEIPEPNEPG